MPGVRSIVLCGYINVVDGRIVAGHTLDRRLAVFAIWTPRWCDQWVLSTTGRLQSEPAQRLSPAMLLLRRATGHHRRLPPLAPASRSAIVPRSDPHASVLTRPDYSHSRICASPRRPTNPP